MILYIYAHPAQMITFQLVQKKTNSIILTENCSFKDIIPTAARYYKQNISNTYIVGDTMYAERVYAMLITVFKNQKIERIKNA